jgi:nucleoside phosphorylase
MSMSLAPGDVDVLLVAAHAPHLAGLRGLLSDTLAGIVRSTRVGTKPVGIGLSAAAVGTTRRLMQTTPRAIVFIGVAGSYPGRALSPGTVVVPSKVVLAGATISDTRAFFPGPMQTSVATHPMISTGIAADPRTKRAAIASTLAWTADDHLAASLSASTGAEAESLELFSVGQAAALLDVPFAAVIGISHEAGGRTRELMRDHERTAAEAACETVSAWLQGGAQGLPV